MKHEIENLTGHFKKISIEIPTETVLQEFNNAFREIQKHAELKGFRKGKVPLNVIEKNYSDAAAKQVAQNLVDRHLNEALLANALRPVAYPELQHGPAKRGCIN